jgi:hypothetical protein
VITVTVLLSTQIHLGYPSLDTSHMMIIHIA